LVAKNHDFTSSLPLAMPHTPDIRAQLRRNRLAHRDSLIFGRPFALH
jgi:hypothetical protein